MKHSWLRRKFTWLISFNSIAEVIRLKIDPEFTKDPGQETKSIRNLHIYPSEKDEQKNKNSYIAEDVLREVGSQV